MEVNPRDRRPHDHLPESRDDITGPVERAPGVAPVPEVAPVEEALRKARALAPAPAPRSDANLGVEANPRNTEPQESVSKASTLVYSGGSKSLLKITSIEHRIPGMIPCSEERELM